MPRLALLLGLALAGCAASRPEAPATPGAYTVLAAAHAEAAVQQCSRASYTIAGSWTPSQADIERLERHLPDLLALPSTACCLPDARIGDLGRYHRQYVGVVIGERRLIYVNAFPLGRGEDPRAPVVVCDGGAAYWGVLFDPEAGTFSDLAFNGEG